MISLPALWHLEAMSAIHLDDTTELLTLVAHRVSVGLTAHAPRALATSSEGQTCSPADLGLSHMEVIARHRPVPTLSSVLWNTRSSKNGFDGLIATALRAATSRAFICSVDSRTDLLTASNRSQRRLSMSVNGPSRDHQNRV